MRVYFADARVPDKVWQSLTLDRGCWMPKIVVAEPRASRARLANDARRVWVALTDDRSDVDAVWSCGRPWCANPRHFDVAGPHELRPGDRPARFCRRGHDFGRDNVHTGLDGLYACRECNRDNSLRYYHRHKVGAEN